MLPDLEQGRVRAGIPVSGAVFRDRRIRGERLDGVVFHRCAFDGVVLQDASLRGTTLVECELNDLVLDGCAVSDLTLAECRGGGFVLSGPPFRTLLVTRGRLDAVGIAAVGDRLIVSEGAIGRLTLGTGAERQHQLTVSGTEIGVIAAPAAHWEQASLVGFDLARLEAAQGRFRASSFIESDGVGADLSGLAFERCNFFSSALRGSRIREARECIFAACDLSGADLEGAALAGSIFPEAVLDGARMAGADLTGALFPGADLRRSDLGDARAARSVWTGADLRGARARRLAAPWGVFRNARMEGADVEGADLAHADLGGVEEALDGAGRDHARRSPERRAERDHPSAPAEEPC